MAPCTSLHAAELDNQPIVRRVFEISRYRIISGTRWGNLATILSWISWSHEAAKVVRM